MVSPRKLVRDSIGFAGAQLLVRVAIIARTIIAARLLGPQVLGVWNGLQLLMDYGPLAPLGTQQGLDQMVPRRMVDSDAPALARVKRAGITTILVLTLLFGSACCLYFFQSHGNLIAYWGVPGFLLAMLIVLLTNWANYHTTLLRSHGNIGAVSMWFFVQGLIGAVLGLALLQRLGGWGLLVGWTVGTLAAFLWTRWEARRIAPLRPFVGAETADLVKIGFPMYFFVGSAIVIRNLDRLIVLRALGTGDLGYYSLAVTALTLLMYLPDSATYVSYPRLLQRFRAGGDRPEAVRSTVIDLSRILSVLTPFLGGILYFLVRDVIETVLPKYAVGVQAVRVMCFTASAVSLGNFGSILLMTVGRQIVLIPVSILSIGAFVVADLLAVRAGLGITGVAWATLVAYSVTGLAILILAFTALEIRGAALIRRLLLTFSGMAAALVLAPVIDRLMPFGNGGNGVRRLLHALLGSATFVVAYALVALPQLRGLGIRRIISELSIPLPAWLRRALNGDSAPGAP